MKAMGATARAALLGAALLGGCTLVLGDRPNPCARPNAVCEDFEHAIAKPLTSSTIRAVAQPDSNRAHGGSRSLHIDLQAADGMASTSGVVGLARTPAQLGEGFWVRAYVYMEGPLPTNDVVLFDAERGKGAGSAGLRVSGKDHAVEIHNYLDGDPVAAHFANLSAFIRPDAWACVRWHVPIGKQATIAGGVGATLSPETVVFDTVFDTPIEELFLGATVLDRGVDVAHSVWIDDLVIADEDPGCTD